MKHLTLFAVLFALSAACIGVQSEPEPEPEPEQLALDWYNNYACPESNNTAGVKIVSGNGGYAMVYPKYLSLFEKTEGGGKAKEVSRVAYPDYLESVCSIRIDKESSEIIFEYKPSDMVISAYFMVKDAEVMRDVFLMEYHPVRYVGGQGTLGEMWRPSAPDVDYWANY